MLSDDEVPVTCECGGEVVEHGQHPATVTNSTRTLDSRYLTPRQRDWLVSKIMDHEAQCATCSDDGLLAIEAHLRKSSNAALLAEYANYFPSA